MTTPRSRPKSRSAGRKKPEKCTFKVWIARGKNGRLMPFSDYDRVPAVYLTRSAALRHWADVDRATLTLSKVRT